MAVSACAGETPGLSRAMIVSQRLVRLWRSSQVGVICAFIRTGTRMLGT